MAYYGYRYYDPQTGRWSSRDPINEIGGPLWSQKFEKYQQVLKEYDDDFRAIIDYFDLNSTQRSALESFYTKVKNDLQTELHFGSLQDLTNDYEFCSNDPLLKYDFLGLNDKPKRNLNCEGFTKKSDPDDVKRALDAAKAAGQAKRAAALKALWKVIKRGGALGIMFDFIQLQMEMELNGGRRCCPAYS